MFLANAGVTDFPISTLFKNKLFSPENRNKCNSFKLTVLTLQAKLTCKYSHLLTTKLDVRTVNVISSFHFNIQRQSKPISDHFTFKSEFILELLALLRNHSNVVLEVDEFVYFPAETTNNYRLIFP